MRYIIKLYSGSKQVGEEVFRDDAERILNAERVKVKYARLADAWQFVKEIRS